MSTSSDEWLRACKSIKSAQLSAPSVESNAGDEMGEVSVIVAFGKGILAFHDAITFPVELERLCGRTLTGLNVPPAAVDGE